MFEAPIPGQSLTDTPKNYAWERPPQYDTPEEAIEHYLKRLANEDVMDDLAVMFDNGAAVAPFVKTLTTYAEMEGVHSIDVGLIISPVIHAFIKAAMSTYGIEVIDEDYDPSKDPEQREKQRIQTAINFALSASKATAKEDEGIALLEEVSDSLEEDVSEEGMETPVETSEAEMPEEDETTMQEQPEEPQGLMSKGAV